MYASADLINQVDGDGLVQLGRLPLRNYREYNRRLTNLWIVGDALYNPLTVVLKPYKIIYE